MSAGGSAPLRVLLTGAAGYLGSHVHRALLAAGHQVIAVDALLGAVHGADPVVPEGVSRIDIRDWDRLFPLLADIDVVCHLAAAVPLPHRLEPSARPREPMPRQRDPFHAPVVDHGAGQEISGRDGGQLADGESSDGNPDAVDLSGGASPDAAHRDSSGAAVGAARTEPEGTPRARRDESAHGAGPCVRGPATARAGSERAGPEGTRAAALYAAHNDVGTATLLAAMERAGVARLVLGSSVAVYGEGRYRSRGGGPFYPGLRRRGDLDRGLFDHRAPRSGEVLTWEPMAEDAPLRPRSAYAASKVAQEHYALAWVANNAASAAVLRYHYLYGDPVADGRRVHSAETGVAARFRAELRAGRPPRVFEDGGQVRDFTHVRDAALATVAAVERSLNGFVPLNVASGRPLTLWEVASTMAKAVDGPSPLVTGQYRITDIRHVVAHPERARHALDFSARIAPAQGLADYAASRDAR